MKVSKSGSAMMIGGQCIKFGDSVNTDIIIPARYLVSIDPNELGEHAFEPLGAKVQERLRRSQVLVAGVNFGCGSAREQAASCLVGAGIKVVIAKSFARVFFRNSINTGLLAVVCPAAAEAVADGDQVFVDMTAGTITAGEQVFRFAPYPESLKQILDAGGLLPYVAQHVLSAGDQSMGKTFAEKVMARAAGLPETTVGQVVDVYPQVIMSHAASWRCIKALEKLGTDKLFDVDRIAMVMDHTAPAHLVKTAADQKVCREFARSRGIKKFYDVDAGIAHVVLIENGYVRPGMVLIGTDSHSTIYGALGAAGTGVGFSEVTATWVTGYLWMRVPESIKVVIDGPLAPGTSAKDVMLKLVGDVTADGATYCSMEFHGSFVEGLSISERMTLCNLAMEAGVKFAYVPPDAVTRAYLAERGVKPTDYDEIYPDPDASYIKTILIEGPKLVPQIACPPAVENVKPIDAVAGTKVDQVFIGSCANAKYEDLVIAASILKGHKVAPWVRLMITPGSKNILAQIVREGIYSSLLESGALITNPGCGACAGDGGIMADGEVTLSTANRNFPGRMGSYKAEIYLASPAVAAATAIRGVITDPREFLA